MDIDVSEDVKEEVTRKRKTGFDRIIDSFKYSSNEKPSSAADSIIKRREKLVEKIEEQVELIAKPNSNYLERYKRVRNKQTNLIEEKVYFKRINRWFFEEKGTIYLQVRYGNRILEFKKGKPSIVCKNIRELEETLFKLRECVENGELDEMLKSVSYEIARRFR